MRNLYMLRSAVSRCLFLVLLTLSFQPIFAQTILIDPATGGGFESGTDFTSNGWTVANGTATNKWYVGSVPTGFSGNAAYVSNNSGTAWSFTNTNTSVVHFYRDVTIPAGQTDVTLSFDWIANGESGSWDAVLVSVAPVSYTPTGSTTSLGTGTLAAPATTLQMLWLQTTTQTATFKIPYSLIGNCTSAQTIRLIFTWKNDSSGGGDPPGGIDNISLTSQAVPVGRITAAGGTFTINSLGSNTGNNFVSFTDAVDALNAVGMCANFTNPVIFNVSANQSFTEIVPAIHASGSSTNGIIFRKSGAGANPVVNRSDAGTVTTSTMGGQGDAVITIDGGDYITFENIDVSTADAGIEYGYFFRKGSGTDGCKNDTIRGSNITLTMLTTGTPYNTGIYISNLDAGAAASSSTGVTVTAVSGRNENIYITGNTLNNCFHGIQVRGFAASTPYDLYDQNITIGATGAVAGVPNRNSIVNYGAVGTAVAYGIYTVYSNNTSIVNNLIDNNGTPASGTIYGVYGSTQTNANWTVSNNKISLMSGYASGSLYGIYNSASSGNLTVANDTISLGNSIASSGTFGFIYNASATASTAINISNNVFANSAYNTTGTTYLIYNSVGFTSLATIQGNKTETLQNDGAGSVYGYYNGAATATGTEVISQNNFSNVNINATASFYGIYSSTAATGRRNVFSNVISTISTGSSIYGIYKSGGIGNIYRNKVVDLSTSNAGTTAVVYGVYISSGAKDSVYNNILGDYRAPSLSNASGVAGIYSTSATATSTIGLYYNSIYLSGSGGTDFGASGIYATESATATTAALEMKNNLVVMDVTASGTGYAAAYRRSGTSLTNYASSSNNNLFKVITPSVNSLYFYDGTNSDQTLGDLKARLSPREGASVSETPNFLSTTSSAATYLHINATTATQIESAGSGVSGITTDFDGDTRNASTPDIGADEFAGIAADLTGPAIGYTPLTNSICIDARTITATITDASGVNVTAGTKPRLYYKKSSETNALAATNTSASNGWKWVEAPESASPFTFLVDYSKLTSAVVNGDSISYFVVAQDIASTPNVGVNNATFAVNPTSVALTAGAFPATGGIRGYKILSLPNPIAISVDKTDLCGSGTVVLNVNGVDVSGGSYQWQSSPMGANTWSDIAGATTIPFTTASLTASTDFRLVVKCGGTPVATSPSPTVTVNVNNPQVSSINNGTRCGTGTVALSVVPGAGQTIKWYAAASGGSPIQTGNNFTTPVISSTTTYYVSASSGTASFAAGLPGQGAYGTFGSPGGSGYGIYFTTNSAMTIQTAYVYPQGAGSTTIQLQDGTGTLVPGQTVTVNFTAGDVGLKTPVTLNFAVPAAGSYRLMNTAGTAYLGRYNPYSGPAFPLSYGGGALVVTQGSAGTTTYYSFFDLQVVVACEGVRSPITASVTSAPALTSVSATQSTICAGQSTTLNVTSGNAGYTYSWAPGSLAGASVSVSPTSSTTYTVTATDAGTSCVTTGTVAVSVNPRPSAVVFTSPTVTLCPGSTPQQLTFTGGSLTNVPILSENFNGAATGWTVQNNTSNPITNWTLRPDGYVRSNTYHSNDNSQFFLSDADAGSSGQTVDNSIISPAFSTVGFTTCQISFYNYFRYIQANEVAIEASTNGTTWTALTPATDYTATQGAPGAFVQNTVDLTAYAGMPTVYIRFRYTTGWGWYWAIDNVSISGTASTNITWSPSAGLFTDAAGTTPYSGGITSTVYANPGSNTTYTATATSAASCTNTGTVSVTRSSAITTTTALAGTPGGAATCANYDVSVSNNYFNNCAIIATVVPNGASAVSGTINACVTVDASVLAAPNGQRYVARHFNILPATNATTATSRITLYFKQSEFTAYNAVRGAYPALPTGGADATGIANLRVTQYNGTGTAPGNYTGTATLINPVDADVTYDAAADRWSVAFDATGSGGFYLHTGNFVLPVTIVDFKGEISGAINKLSWSTSTETNSKGFYVERSADGRTFSSLSFITTKADNGNSAVLLNYLFNDEKPLTGTGYYRLMQVDKDGKFSYSNVVKLSRKLSELVLSSVYPNPASLELNLKIASPTAEKVSLVVTDLTGKVIMQRSVNVVIGDNVEQLNISAIAAGTYLIKAVCANGCETAVHKFVKQ